MTEVQTLFKVDLQGYGDLTETERLGVSNNGWGAEYATYIRVTHRGQTILLENDAMEPEDARLSRDLKWIVDALMKAYTLGLEDGGQIRAEPETVLGLKVEPSS